jgi:hypothetical protein
LVRALEYFDFAMLLILLSPGIGILEYQKQTGIFWIDSLLNATVNLRGMEPTNEMPSLDANLLTLVFAIFRVIVFLSMVTRFFTPFDQRLLHLIYQKHTNGN